LNKTLITFFTILFCITSSVGLTEQTSKNEKNKSLAKGILETLTKPKITKKNDTKIKENVKSDNKKKESNKNLEDNYKTIKKYSSIIQNHISKNWMPNYNSYRSKIKFFPMQISLNPDGSVVDVKYVGYKVINSNIDKIIINNIKSVIQKSSPLPIPIDKYNIFKNFILEFDVISPIPK